MRRRSVMQCNVVLLHAVMNQTLALGTGPISGDWWKHMTSLWFSKSLPGELRLWTLPWLAWVVAIVSTSSLARLLPAAVAVQLAQTKPM